MTADYAANPDYQQLDPAERAAVMKVCEAAFKRGSGKGLQMRFTPEMIQATISDHAKRHLMIRAARASGGG